jgi:N6-L-threonylcarbamoyladenine synthase
MEIIGQTQDDAVGEAFDKAAKMLELPYPGGPILDKNAQLGKPVFKFPLVEVQDLNYSFSGIKTAFLYFLRDQKIKNPDFVNENMNDICASFQQTLVDILLKKVKKAAKENQITHIAIAGGVSANSGLRTQLKALGQTLGWTTYIPAFEYCTDNAGMIAMAAHYKYLQGDFCGQDVSPMPRMAW